MARKQRQFEGFSCRRCGFCCSLSGFVLLEAGEAERIAAFLGIGVYEFTERYACLSIGRRHLSLTEREDGACIFLDDDRRCRIQPVKPVQCRRFPFAWSSRDLEAGCAGLRALEQKREG
jgi:uncharacterized protein